MAAIVNSIEISRRLEDVFANATDFSHFRASWYRQDVYPAPRSLAEGSLPIERVVSARRLSLTQRGRSPESRTAAGNDYCNRSGKRASPAGLAVPPRLVQLDSADA